MEVEKFSLKPITYPRKNLIILSILTIYQLISAVNAHFDVYDIVNNVLDGSSLFG